MCYISFINSRYGLSKFKSQRAVGRGRPEPRPNPPPPVTLEEPHSLTPEAANEATKHRRNGRPPSSLNH